MRIIRCVSLSIILSGLFITAAQADSLYRQRLPFTLPITSDDRLYVSYNFSEKTGIRCTSNHKKVRLDFTYKGKEKTALLPVVLQSDHIPHKKDEVLADVNGRLMISASEDPEGKLAFEVNCGYVERK